MIGIGVSGKWLFVTKNAGEECPLAFRRGMAH
jgi:hypothetical protein